MNQTNHIDEQLLLQYLLGNSEVEQRQRIEEWLNKSEAHRKQLDRLEVLWLETGKLDPPPVAVDTVAAWLRVSDYIDAARQERGKGSPGRLVRKQTFQWVSGIAAVLLIALGTWWLTNKFSSQDQMQVVASMEEVVRDTLPDGSTVTLNKNSSLTFPESFEDGKREVALHGEAFFEVAPDPNMHFIVQAGHAGIQVLGTAFNVRAYPGRDMEVSVLSGEVIFFSIDPQTGDSASVILTKGMKGVITTGSNQPEIDSRHIPDDLFWLNQTLQFRQTPLTEVIRLLENRYHTTILLSSEQIGGCRLTATFTGEPIELILRVIADTFTLNLAEENGTYLLAGNGCVDENR